MYEVLAYEAGDGSCPYEEFKELVRRSGDRKVLRIVDAIVTKLGEVGLALLETSMMDNIEDDIYELRPGSYRVFCFYDRAPSRFVLLHGFRKQTRRTPEAQKDRARNSVGQYLNSIGG